LLQILHSDPRLSVDERPDGLPDEPLRLLLRTIGPEQPRDEVRRYERERHKGDNERENRIRCPFLPFFRYFILTNRQVSTNRLLTRPPQASGCSLHADDRKRAVLGPGAGRASVDLPSGVGTRGQSVRTP